MTDRASNSKRRSGLAAAALGALLPGLGHGYVGYRMRAVLMALPVVFLASLAYVVATMSTVDLLSWLVRPAVLQGILIANLVIVVWRIAAVADPYRVSAGAHSLGRLLVVVGLAIAVSLPHVLIARYTLDAAQLLDEVFVTEGEEVAAPLFAYEEASRAAPFAPGDTDEVIVADPATIVRQAEPRSVRNLVFREGVGDPDAVAHSIEYRQQRDLSLGALIGSEADGVDRITILLAGGDGGPGRGGSRTDTIMVVTFDTVTGKSAVFSIPRNMTHMPLPDAWSTAFVELEQRLTPWDERKAWTDEDGTDSQINSSPATASLTRSMRCTRTRGNGWTPTRMKSTPDSPPFGTRSSSPSASRSTTTRWST